MLRLDSKDRRRLFYLLAVLCLALLVLLRREMENGGALASIADNLIASVLSALVLLSLALYLWPTGEGTHELRPGEIRGALLAGDA